MRSWIGKRLDGFRGKSRVAVFDDRYPPDEPGDGHPPRFALSVCAIMKDEGPYLREWLEFHRLVGVDHFYLYDNGSTDDSVRILEPYVRAGIVDLVPWPRFIANSNPQYLAYAHAVRFAAGTSRWLAAIDLDEFLFSPQERDLRAALVEYQDLPALIVFVRNFGTSGHQTKPSGLVVESYLKRRHHSSRTKLSGGKTIVQPRWVRAIGSAHHFENTTPYPGYDETRQPVIKGKDGRCDDRSERFRVNHYRTKSEEEWQAKKQRGRVTARPGLAEKLERIYRDVNENATVQDTSILYLVPELRSRLAQAGVPAAVPAALEAERPRPQALAGS
jgi:Glycosyltransferase family 92